MAAASQGQGGLALPAPSGLEGRLVGGLAEKGAGGGGREGCIDAQSSAQDGRWGQKKVGIRGGDLPSIPYPTMRDGAALCCWTVSATCEVQGLAGSRSFCLKMLWTTEKALTLHAVCANTKQHPANFYTLDIDDFV